MHPIFMGDLPFAQLSTSGFRAYDRLLGYWRGVEDPKNVSEFVQTAGRHVFDSFDLGNAGLLLGLRLVGNAAGYTAHALFSASRYSAYAEAARLIADGFATSSISAGFRNPTLHGRLAWVGFECLQAVIEREVLCRGVCHTQAFLAGALLLTGWQARIALAAAQVVWMAVGNIIARGIGDLASGDQTLIWSKGHLALSLFDSGLTLLKCRGLSEGAARIRSQNLTYGELPAFVLDSEPWFKHNQTAFARELALLWRSMSETKVVLSAIAVGGMTALHPQERYAKAPKRPSTAYLAPLPAHLPRGEAGDMPPSSVYLDVFNERAAVYGIRRVDGATATTRTVDPWLGPVDIVDLGKWRAFLSDRRAVREEGMLEAMVRHIRLGIEADRERLLRAVAEKSYPRSSAIDEECLGTLNAAERAWLERVGPEIHEHSLRIVSSQFLADSAACHRWIEARGTALERFAFHKTRGDKLRIDPVEGITPQDRIRLGNPLPWLPELRGNRMWPHGFEKADIAFLRRRYSPGHAVFLPFTRVLRTDESGVGRSATEAPRRNAFWEQVEWLVKGRRGISYRVVNMSFDDEARPHFLAIARLLREHADIRVDSDDGPATLDEPFRSYLRQAATCIEEGAWIRLMQLDLDQRLARPEGRLHFSLSFPEGYEPFGVKYLLAGEIGVLDLEIARMAEPFAALLPWLCEETARIARDHGLSEYAAAPADPDNIRRDAYVEAYRVFGFIHTLPAVMGRDDPKRRYRGISPGIHRSIGLIDAVRVVSQQYRHIVRACYDESISERIEAQLPTLLAILVAIHEDTHGSQIPQDMPVGPNRKPFNTQFGPAWELLVEPWADLGVMKAVVELESRGELDFDRASDFAHTLVAFQLPRFPPRKPHHTLDFMLERWGGHQLGGYLYLSELYDKGGMTVDAQGRITLDVRRVFQISNDLFERLAGFAARGEAEAYTDYLRAAIDRMPQEVVGRLWEQHGAKNPSPGGIDRGDLGPRP